MFIGNIRNKGNQYGADILCTPNSVQDMHLIVAFKSKNTNKTESEYGCCSAER